MTFIILLGIGLLAGILSGILGIGGGVVIVPLLLLTSMPVTRAIGTSLGALLLPVGAFGAWAYYKSGNLDVKAAVLVAAGLAVGVLIGARYAQAIPPATLKRLFAALMIVVAARMWMTA